MRRVAIVLSVLAAGCGCMFGLNPALDINQYAHTAWTVRDGFALGNIYAMAQTPDGYLWFGTEFGLFRFDGVRTSQWQPPAGQHLPQKININSLLVTRDGTLWIGTFSGLATWDGRRLTMRPELGRQFVSSLFEDREGTVWAATLELPAGRLCAIRSSGSQCYAENGAFGRAVWALYEDNSGTLWAGAQSGLWRWKPGPPRRYASAELVGLSKAGDGRLLIAVHGGGLKQISGDKLQPFPISNPIHSNTPLRDPDVDSNRLLRDRDGGLWIGTVERGLIHIHNGHTDVYRKADGLSGDVILSVFEDREGDIWVASTGGLDRFRELSVTTISVKQGLSSDASQSVLAAKDGSIWIGAHEGLSRWKDGQVTVYGKLSGLPDNAPESLFQDDRGRIWVSTRHGLAYFQGGRFVVVEAVPSGEVHYMTGDKAGDLWLSEQRSLFHLREERLVEQIPWLELGRQQSAELLLCDRERGGLWLGFWVGGGLAYFKDGRFRTVYTASNGLGDGGIPHIQIDPDGTLWASTQEGGLSRLKGGRIITLTTRNGLPCNTINWTIQDDHGSFWLYTACGLVRIRRAEIEAWIADPTRKTAIRVWDAADGVRLRSTAASAYGPRVTKAIDGKIWFVTGEGIQVVDPNHLVDNRFPPPVHIEQITADGKVYQIKQMMHLPARARDVSIGYTALSLAAPEKVHFKYKLEGQDQDWRDAVNDREVQYSNLAPGPYRFRVVASNNSGVWNEAGDSLEFSIDPAFYQTSWFNGLCALVFLSLLWVAHQFRVRQLRLKFNLASEARLNERMRIARELHDNLLQTVQGLMLSLQAVSEMMPAGAAKNKFEKTLEIGDRAIREGRDAVQDLRSASTTSDLTEAVRALGDELARGDGATFRLVVEGPLRELHPVVRDEIYSIAREALRNAFIHAYATRIEAEIEFNERLLRLRIRDDGKGVSPETAQQGSVGHYGIAGMRERARQIGSKLVILSGPGTGTEVELSVPGSVAYAKRPGRFRFTLFRWSGGVRL